MVKQTLLQLTEDLVKALDQRASREGVSRSALVRRILQESVQSDRQAVIGAEIAAGYRRIPPGGLDEWGDQESLGDVNTTDLLHRLDAEESARG